MSARPFRLTSPMPREKVLHEDTVRLLRLGLLPPAVWFAMPLGHIELTGQQGAVLSRIGATRGLPDLFIIHAGQVFAIELKRVGGRLSKTRWERTRSGAQRLVEGQEDVFPRLERAGVRIAVCHDTDEVLLALHRWGLPVRIAALERAA